MNKFFQFRFPISIVMWRLFFTAAGLLVMALCNYNGEVQYVLAHETFNFGNISVSPGWEVEPPLVDQLNSIEIVVANEETGNSTAIRNAFSELDASIKSGGLTKTLDFAPQEESAGLYRAEILPTQVGSYSLLLVGQINGQPINSEIGIEDVEDVTQFAFPLPQSKGSSISAPIASAAPLQGGAGTNPPDSSQLQMQQLSPLISDLTNQINSSAETAARAEGVADETGEIVGQLSSNVDRAYVFGMISMAVGISGIIIGAFALTRKRDRLGLVEKKK